MPIVPLATVKAAVDLELPTPLQAWVQLTHDEMRHHPHESAEFFATFNGQPYRFYGGCERSGASLIWHVAQDDGPNTSRARQGIVSDATTWALAKAAFAIKWEAICEAERDREAVRRYSGDVMDEPERAQDARMAGVSTFGATWTFGQAFDEDIYEYDVTTAVSSLGVHPTKKFAGQTVRVESGGVAQPDGLPAVSIPAGDGTVTVIIMVTAEDGVQMAVYTLTIHR